MTQRCWCSRRGRRRQWRGVPRYHRRPAGALRPRAGARHAARRDRDRRHGDRHGGNGAQTGGRISSRASSTDHRSHRQSPRGLSIAPAAGYPVRWCCAPSGGGIRAPSITPNRRPCSQCAGAAGGRALLATARLRPAAGGDPRPRSGGLPRADTALPALQAGSRRRRRGVAARRALPCAPATTSPW